MGPFSARISATYADGLAAGLIVGAPRSGKTTALARQVRATDGPALVLAATREGACALQEALADLPQVQVMPWTDAALAVMAEPTARARFNRQPRLLEPYEEDILREDLKVVEVKKKHRMQKILDYLFYGWSSLEENDGSSLDTSYTWEESDIIDQLHESLEFTGGMLKGELANFCVKTLLDEPDVLARHRVPNVFVDDYHTLTRAAQQVTCLLAGQRLWVASSSVPVCVADEDYPCYEGAQELLDAFPGAQVVQLANRVANPALARAAADEALAPLLSGLQTALPGQADACAPEATPATVLVGCEGGMEDELRRIAQVCDQALQQNRKVLVVGANGVWRSNVVNNLSKAGLPIDFLKGDVRLGRDLREEAAYRRARKDALAKLAADPDDGVAWRSMLAFGDYLANSAGVDVVRKAVRGTGLRIHQALEQLAAGQTVNGHTADEYGISHMVEEYNNAKAQLAQAAQEGSRGGDRSAEEPAPILVCSPYQAFSAQTDVVVFGGCVTGFIPNRAWGDPTELVGGARQRERTRVVRTLFTVASRAAWGVAFTGFSTCSLPTAEHLKLHVVKSGLRNGVRMATVQPCEFLEPYC